MDPEKPYVLVVDDDEKIIELIKVNLELSGLEVMTASDGEEAIKKIFDPARPPDLMILDVMMPKINGYEVARKVRESAALKSLPIIMVSAKHEPLDKVQALIVSEVDFYLTKPFDINDLLILVLKCLANIVSRHKADANGQK